MANFYSFPVKAGKRTTANVRGKMILIDAIDGADGVDITPVLNSQEQRTMPGRKKAFKCWVDYDSVVLESDTDCTVDLFLSSTDVSLGFADGALVNVVGGVSILNDQGSRVPVDLAGGVVNVTADNVVISNDNTKPVPVKTQALGQIVNKPAVVVQTGAAQSVVNDATLKRLVFRNESAGRIALGGQAVTLANAAIILNPGDAWTESDAAGANWYATSDANGADLRVMGVKP